MPLPLGSDPAPQAPARAVHPVLVGHLSPGADPFADLPQPTLAKPARHARVTITQDGDMMGQCHIAGHAQAHTKGWIGVLIHMGMHTHAPSIDADTRAIRHAAMHWHTITSASPSAGPLGGDTIALFTRDAVGWAFGPPHKALLRDHCALAPFRALPEGTYWPMLWLRPAPSRHAVLARAKRLQADLEFLAQTTPGLHPAPFLPDMGPT